MTTEDRIPETEDDLKDQVKKQGGIQKVEFSKAPKKLREILDEIMPEGEKVKVADIVGWKIVIHSVRIFTGEMGPAAYVVFTDEGGAIYNTIIGQSILLPKILAAEDDLPVECEIVRHEGGRFGGYYDFA